MKEAKFEDLFLEELGDLYDAEKQIMAALPKMIAASSSGELARALQQHLDETKEHTARLERIFEEIGEEVRGRDSIGMKGLIESGESLIEDAQKSTVLDAAFVRRPLDVQYDPTCLRIAIGRTITLHRARIGLEVRGMEVCRDEAGDQEQGARNSHQLIP